MSGSTIDKSKLVMWGVIGTFVVAFAPIAKPARELAAGFLGSTKATQADNISPAKLQAELAKPALSRELEPDELKELAGAISALLSQDVLKALPIIGKYALMGEPRAQAIIASMYLHGDGLPLDHAQGIRWLRLAAAQGGQAEQKYLTEVMSVMSDDTAIVDQRHSYIEAERVRFSGGNADEYRPSLPAQFPQSGLGAGASTSYAAGSTMPDGLSFTPRREVYSTDSAGRAWLNEHGAATKEPNRSGARSGALQVGSALPTILNRAGPGTYSDERGDVYTQAGAHGVVNTRSGEFSPTN